MLALNLDWVSSQITSQMKYTSITGPAQLAILPMPCRPKSMTRMNEPM